MKVKIKDVARKAGVSIATVSHVINGTHYVKEETRQLVLDAIDELGYVPDLTARNLKTGKKNIIGFIIPDISNPYFTVISEQIESVLAKQGYSLFIANTKGDPKLEIEKINLLSSGLSDGLIIASSLPDFESFPKNITKNLPCVFVDRRLNTNDYDIVSIYSYDAFYEGIQSLIHHGHRKIGLIVDAAYLSTTVERIAAYRDAFTNAGLSPCDDLIKYGYSKREYTIPATVELLDAGCTAIVAASTRMAIDAIYYLKKKHIVIGTDIALLVLNEYDPYALFDNAVEIIQQPASEFGRQIGTVMMNRIKYPNAPLRDVILYSSLKGARIPG